jgi:uncharacterized membrane protein
MENKNVGFLILGFSVLIVIIIFMFNSSLKNIIRLSCGAEHAVSCPMTASVNQQTYLALGIVGLLFIVGLVLIFSKPKEKIIIKKIKERKQKRKIDTSELNSEEKKVLKMIQENKAIFQADLIEKTGFGKVKITRIIDRLEGKGFVERKRRGMTNIVVLKEI